MSGDLRLSGLRALVTGGTKGVGEAVVARLRDPGAKVLTTARSGVDHSADAMFVAADSSGLDAARKPHARHALRCIFVSGNVDEPTRTALMPYEPIDFICKPVLPVVLQRALKKAEGLTEL